jgi:uncharacterized membrane protein
MFKSSASTCEFIDGVIAVDVTCIVIDVDVSTPEDASVRTGLKIVDPSAIFSYN